MWFGQTGLNVNRFETGLSASVNGAYHAKDWRFPVHTNWGLLIVGKAVRNT